MPKPIYAQITRFGYILIKNKYSREELDQIRADLTVKPFKLGNYGRHIDNSFSIYIENSKYMSIPKYYGIDRFGAPKINKLETHTYPSYLMKYTGQLRPHQEVIVGKMIAGLEKERGGILVAGCGIGKTNMAIYIACHFGVPVLWLTHKEFLARQVAERVRSVTNITQIGIIQQKKIQPNNPFVIGMIQSVSKIDYDDKIFENFGMIIIDEVHHMGAKNYSKIFQKMTAKFMLGISAEKARTDGLYGIINWYMGPILHAEEQEPNDSVIVKRFMYSTNHKKRIKEIYLRYGGDPDRSTMITNLTLIKKRNGFIQILLEVLFDMGRNVLCLTSRLKQITALKKRLEKSDKGTKDNVGIYIGGMKAHELQESSTKQIILGTFEMAQEGLDLDNLNVLVMCTPKSAVRQCVGRILRKKIFETNPIVIDICDIDNEVFAKQANTRKRYFEKQEYRIQDFKVADYEKKKFNMHDDTDFIRSALEKLDVKQKKLYEEVDCDDIVFLD